MKLKLLPLAIGAVIATPGMALAAPTVYGKLNVTLESYEFSPQNTAAEYDQWEVNSNASRVGVKGSEKISDDLSAVYQAEFQIYVDDGDSGADNGNDTFEQRNIYAGLRGGFGEVIVGRFDTPLKTAQNKVDQFDNYKVGDISNVIPGDERTDNTIQYSTPDMGAISAKVALIQAEGACTDADTNCDDGIADGISASVAFEQDGIYAAIAADSDVDGLDSVRLVAQANIDVFQLGLIYQTSEESDPAAGATAEELDGYILSAAMNVGTQGKVKFQYGESELNNFGGVKSADTIESTQVGVGFEHALSKQTKLFTHYITADVEQGASTNEATTLAFGMEHKF